MLNLECPYLKNKASVMRVMTAAFTETSDSVKGYLKENWGTPFVLGFMLLLIVATVSLALGSTTLADGIAIAAYCASVIGVILQVVCFLKHDKTNGGKNHDSS